MKDVWRAGVESPLGDADCVMHCECGVRAAAFQHTRPSKREARRRRKRRANQKLREQTLLDMRRGKLGAQERPDGAPEWADLSDSGGQASGQSPSARLSAAAKCWKFAPPDVKDLLTKGMPIEFVETPPKIHLPRCELSAEETAFINAQLPKLAARGICKRCAPEELHCTSPLFTEPKANKPGEFRLLIDLSISNAFVRQTPAFDMMGIRHASQCARDAKARAKKNGTQVHAIVWDVTDAFFSMRIREEFKKFFGFEIIGPDGELQTWVWLSAPQGFTASPHWFDKAMSCLVACLRERSGGEFEASCHCDDGIAFVGGSRAHAERVAAELTQLLRVYGWGSSPTKSWPAVPASQTVTHIGYTFYLESMRLGVSERRRNKMLGLLERMSAGKQTAHTVRKMCGMVVSAETVFGNRVFKRMRSLNEFLSDDLDIDDPRRNRTKGHALGPAAATEVHHWQQVISGDPKVPLIREWRTRHMGATDASATGVGGTLSAPGSPLSMSAGALPAHSMNASSALRELEGCTHHVKTHGRAVRGGAAGFARGQPMPPVCAQVRQPPTRPQRGVHSARKGGPGV